MAEQLTLFKDELPKRPPVRKPSGGSANPIVFRDYDSYVAKFINKEKTTDDTYTPRDVFDAVVKYVGNLVDMKDKLILRPFYPGGDYENADYPENGVVIDNPPFSMFTKICAFYSAYGIPFFLFGPGLTIASCCKYCTAVIISEQITFDNGAKIKCNFASNLYGDTLITTAPLLDQLLKACPSQNAKVNLPKFRYPEEVLDVSAMQTICRGGIEFKVMRNECEIIRNLDLHPKGGGLFGDHFLLSATKGADKEAARQRAQEAARQAIPIQLSPRERRIVERLGEKQSET